MRRVRSEKYIICDFQQVVSVPCSEGRSLEGF